jgi:peptidoglycan/xylan/chitin deacetylase (PgdA/CDA1 family)
LHEKNIPATIFLVSGYIGLENKWDHEKQLAHRQLMPWPQVTKLAEQGVDFGAHSCTHPHLTAIATSQAEEEVVLSRKQLEDRLGMSIDVFAYPYGEYNLSIQEMAERAGFMAACTVDAGLNTLITPSFSLRRTEIQGADSLARFLLALWLGDAEALWWRRRRSPKGHQEQIRLPDNG